GAEELIEAVPAAQQTHAEHAGTARRQQVPDGIPDDIAVIRVDSQSGLAGEEEIGCGLGPRNSTAVDHHRLVAYPERLHRQADLRPAARGRDPVHDAASPEFREQLARPWQWTPFRQKLPEDGAVAKLDRLRLVGRKLAADLPRHSSREQPTAHADASVDPPTIDGHAFRRQGTL